MSCSRCGHEHPEDVACGAQHAARVGAIVAEKWEILRQLGAGGMGEVYEARHRALARPVAIKFLRAELSVDPELSRRFANEARTAGPLTHPNLVAVTDEGRTPDGSAYFVMELLKGEDCAKLLGRLGPLPIERAADIVLQACRGLAAAHVAGIVHRDVKPENLFVTDAGDGTDLVKVLDFGIAKRMSATTVTTRTGVTMGTAYYMSPEQAVSSTDVDGRTDVWSLGVVLYELLSGRRPFEGGDWETVLRKIVVGEAPKLADLRAEIPAGLLQVVATALAKRPSDRFPSMAAFAERLAPYRGRRSRPPGPSPSVTLPESGTAWDAHAVARDRVAVPTAERKRYWVAALGILLLSVVAIAVAVAARVRPNGAAASATALGSPPRPLASSPLLVLPAAPSREMPAPSSGPVRSPFEVSEHASNRQRTAAAPASGRQAATPAPAQKSASPAVSTQPAPVPEPTSRSIIIDKTSPY